MINDVTGEVQKNRRENVREESVAKISAVIAGVDSGSII